MTIDQNALKRAAAAKAIDYVKSGMKLGLGTGSTAEAFLDLLAPRLRDGLKIVGVPTSEATAAKARALGITLAPLDELAPLDLTVDGADEADRALVLIKGGGGALLREKIVAASSRRMVVIADGSKLVDRLGRFPLPVEVIPFGHATTVARIRAVVAGLGYDDVAIRARANNGSTYQTDSGNIIVDCAFGAIRDAAALGAALSDIAGVVDHGLFVGMATTLLIARPDAVEIIERGK